MIEETGITHFPYKVVMTDDEDSLYMDYLEKNKLKEGEFKKHNHDTIFHSCFDYPVFETNDSNWTHYFRNETDAVMAMAVIGKI